jgi:hypothetical protein
MSSFSRKVLNRVQKPHYPLVAAVEETIKNWEVRLQDQEGNWQELNQLIQDPQFLEELKQESNLSQEDVLWRLLEDADQDPLIYGLLHHLTLKQLDVSLTPPLREFVARVLNGDLKRPSFRGREKEHYLNLPRRFLYGRIIHDLVRHHNCYTYRNESKDKDLKRCALDILAAATGLSYDHLKNIWEKSPARALLKGNLPR